MYSVLLGLHLFVCLLVIVVVLIQSGKGAGLQGLLGGGGSDALFSAPSGSMFIRKVTTGLAIGFFLTSLLLTYLGARRGLRTVTRGPWTQGVPGQPGTPGIPPGAQPVNVPQPVQPPPAPPSPVNVD
jgi:preprotein translocase subunit SecG